MAGLTFDYEVDPTGKKSHEPGAKLDHGKSPVWRGAIDYFPRALEAVALVSAVGAEKYSWKGWEKVEDGVNRYNDALSRHLTREAIEGPYDAQTKLLHAAQRAWNALAVVELMLRDGHVARLD
jgi:hypothetical protein